jgi:radical SAM-linked protein
MSHLDLMRLMQRAFKRAGLPLKHTQGYNPRPSVSIALPLSVGVESVCELLDFDLDGEMVSCDEITTRLNATLVPGIRVLETYENGRKIKDLSLLRCRIALEYDAGVPQNCEGMISDLFQRQELMVEKKSKNGPVQQDIIPLIRSITVCGVEETKLTLEALVCCQNPSLNPMQIIAAIEAYLPECKPDHAVCRRMEIYDINEKVFR